VDKTSDSRKALAHLAAARFAMKAGQLGLAAESYRRAIDCEPELVEAHSELGILFLKSSDFNSALEVLRRASELSPSSAAGWFNLGLALIELRQLREARNALEKSVALDSSFGLAHALLGNVLQKLGGFEAAEQQLREAIALQPERVGAYVDLIRGRRMTEADRPWLKSLESLIRSGRLNMTDARAAFYALGKGFEDLSEYEVAMGCYDQANRLALQLSRRRFERDRYGERTDSIMARFSAELLHEGLSDACLDETPVFVVGMLRSGTTLVEQILSSHPEVYGAGELSFFLERLDTPLSEIGSIGSDYVRRLQPASPGAKRIVDKMPHNYAAIGLIRLSLPNARIIHVQRTPADTCLSIYATPFLAAPEFGHDKSHIAFAYREYVRLMDYWRTVLPPSAILHVEYERLVEDQEAETRRMVEFSGLDWSESCLHPELNQRAIETPSRWQVRQPMYRSSIGRWRNFEPWMGALMEAGT